MNRKTARRLVAAAYERGWRNACDDYLEQWRDANYPIGNGKHHDVDSVLDALDPNNILGLR